MGKRSYFVKYCTTKKRAKISSSFPPVLITLIHSFIHSSFKNKQTNGWGNSAIQRWYLKSKLFAEPPFPELRVRPMPQVSSVPAGGFRAPRRGQRAAPAAGSPAETHPSGGGTRGGELATGSWEESRHRRMPWLLEDMAGWLFHLVDILKKKKKEEGKGRGGSTHARTRIRLILPPH